MGKTLIISKEVYKDYFNYDEDGSFKQFMNTILDDSNEIIFTSRNIEDVERMKTYFSGLGYTDAVGFKVLKRDVVKSLIKDNQGENFIVIGNRDKDFELAVNNKLLYIVPNWCSEICSKSLKYGVNIETIEQLEQIIKTVNNQNNWYYHCILEDDTEIYSLLSGMYMKWDVTPEEKELVKGFEDFLKRGKTDYYQILYYHFLAGISNLPKFKDIDIWAIAPSSGSSLNKEMLDFKDKARCMMKKRYTKQGESLFVRHAPITKSHNLASNLREQYGATRHFDSIHLNPSYKVAGKNICIFDDYLTHGNTFEAMRNILRKAGAKKIIFVSLGRFKKNYIYQDYKITGDVTSPNGFEYSEEKRLYIPYICNESARREIENLHKIFNL